MWVQCLAQGHFDMQTGGAGNQTTDLPVSERPERRAAWLVATANAMVRCAKNGPECRSGIIIIRMSRAAVGDDARSEVSSQPTGAGC